MFLHVIRQFEYQAIREHLPKGARILEIGGGTGYQAKQLANDGFDITSVDIAICGPADSVGFPVIIYDGRRLPFADNSFDVIFSSNVLEHILDLEQIHSESLRVLRAGGFCLHVMPSGSWRFWTIVTHYIEMVLKLGEVAFHLSKDPSRMTAAWFLKLIRKTARILWHYAIPPRHGETGNAITEIFTFGPHHWKKKLSRRFSVELTAPIGLFYTGHSIFGGRLSIPIRMKLAQVLGSASVIYKLIPISQVRPASSPCSP